MGSIGPVSAAYGGWVVLTTWVGGGAGLDAGQAAQATPVERGIQLSTGLNCVKLTSDGVLEGKQGGGRGS